MLTTKKRSHLDAADNSHADCPLRRQDHRLQRQEAQTSEAGTDWRREREPWSENKTVAAVTICAEWGIQRPNDDGVHYVMEPARKWIEMKRYNSFILNGIQYHNEDFVFFANEFSIERRKSLESKQPTGASMPGMEKDWVARILEIRTADKHHVYACIYWMYWPDELPEYSMDGKKYPRGRQPYHGRNELVASNHMDVINVVSVINPAQVNQMIENDK